jgi:hypothetical protein
MPASDNTAEKRTAENTTMPRIIRRTGKPAERISLFRMDTERVARLLLLPMDSTAAFWSNDHSLPILVPSRFPFK